MGEEMDWKDWRASSGLELAGWLTGGEANCGRKAYLLGRQAQEIGNANDYRPLVVSF